MEWEEIHKKLMELKNEIEIVEHEASEINDTMVYALCSSIGWAIHYMEEAINRIGVYKLGIHKGYVKKL